MSARASILNELAVPTEHEECKWLTEWAHLHSWHGLRISRVLIHVPNGAFHGGNKAIARMTGGKLRAQGLQSGVFDYIVPVPIRRDSVPGLWMEMKRTRGGVVSEDQQTFMALMQRLGWDCQNRPWLGRGRRDREKIPGEGRRMTENETDDTGTEGYIAAPAEPAPDLTWGEVFWAAFPAGCLLGAALIVHWLLIHRTH